MKKKILLLIILFIISLKVEAAFPSSLSNLSNKYYCDSDVCYQNYDITNGWNYQTLFKTGDVVTKAEFTNGYAIKSSTKKNKKYTTTFPIVCTNYPLTSPTKISGAECKPITDKNAVGYWNKKIRVSIGKFLKTFVIDQYSGQTPAQMAPTDTKKTELYYHRATLAMTEFLYQKKIKGEKQANQTYAYAKTADLAILNNEYNTVNNLKVSVENITLKKETSDAYYLNIPVTNNYPTKELVVSHGGTLVTSGAYKGTYKILKSNLKTGKNTITATASGKYGTYIATNYMCQSDYQTITPLYVEDYEYTGSHSNTFTINYNPNGNIKIIKKSSTNTLLKGVSFGLYSDSICSKSIKSGTTNDKGEIVFSNLEPKTYYYKETAGLTDYVVDNSCKAVTVPTGDTATVTVYNTPYGKLRIKKVNSQGDTILYKDVAFDVYNNSSCTGEPTPFPFNTKGDGIGEISLPEGHYYITETKAPSDDYVLDSIKCFDVGEVKAGETTAIIEVKNLNRCEYDLQTNNTTAGRLKLYRENYQTFNNLLDFNKTTAKEVCNNTEYTLDSSNSCLSVKRKLKASDTFDHNNLSAYNDTLYYNNKTHYCLTEYTLNGSLGNTVTSGQFLSTNNVLSKGTFTKTCYIHEDEVGNAPSEIIINDLLKNYIGEALLGEKVLNNNYESSKIIYKRIDGDYGDFYKYEYSKNVEYYSWDVYATIGKAEVMYDDCSNCKYLGKGVISSFSSSSKTINLPFRITEPNINFLKINGQANCQYRTVPEITDENKLQLEFRPVDTKEPFNRNAKSNWCIINDGNKDCTSDNKIITDTIINKTNSYGMNNGVKQTPKYTIRLSSSDIVNIREYNKNSSGYDDYETMKKDDNGKIRSTFLTSLKDGSLLKGNKLITK